MPNLTVTTAERIAACAAVGLHYWSDSPVPHTVWANGDDNRFHLVRLDRVTRTAHHVCGLGYEKPGMVLTSRCWHGRPIGQWPLVEDRSLTAVGNLATALHNGTESAREGVA